MFGDLIHALRGGFDQLTYFRHTYSPLSPWRRQTAAVIRDVQTEAARYGIRSARVDRRRAYQLARMVVPNRNGDHLVDLLPAAYLIFSPPSAATFHSGRRAYEHPRARLAAFLRHPQTLAYAMTSPKLCRLGVGASVDDDLVVIRPGETDVDKETLMKRLQGLCGGKGPGDDLRALAEVLIRLNAGIDEPAEVPTEAQEAA